MAGDKTRNGQAEYGTVHVMEEAMREAGQGVFKQRAEEPKRNPAKKGAK